MLDELLKRKKAPLIKKWIASVIDSYPSDTALFLKNTQDAFANPVGATIQETLTKVYEELLQSSNPEKVKPLLEPLIKIRAVQNHTPSQALRFIFSLKEIIINELKENLKKENILEEIIAFEAKMDRLCNTAFDIYAECKDNLYAIKTARQKTIFRKALKKAGWVGENGNQEELILFS